jgi:5-methylcytosine-specific restriction endonuclease McrA
MTTPFNYPNKSTRKHGPLGYADYASYRPWLRDEFAYRCIFCLLREQWGTVRGTFALDHFLPLSLHPELETTYDNLLYACVGCNSIKSDQLLPDPTRSLAYPNAWVTEDGRIHGKTKSALMLIEGLGLDSDEMTQFRMLWIGIISLADRSNRELYRQLLQYPEQLPDLRILQPPQGNRRPEGIVQSAFALRTRGELPVTY